MSNLAEKEVVRGLTISQKDNGLWISFKNNGKSASVNIQTKFEKTKIIKETIIEWAESHLYA